jgi:hypothetical protein
MSTISRRQFIKLVAGTGAAILLDGCHDDSERASIVHNLPEMTTIRREQSLICHELFTEGTKTLDDLPKEDMGEYDVIILGGGISGLTAGLELTGSHRLILEKEAHIGGQAISATNGDVRYSQGAAYLTEPYGILREFFDKWGIRLAQAKEPVDSMYINDKLHTSLFADSALEEFASFRDRILNLDPFPELPISTSSAQTFSYDKVSLAEFLEQSGQRVKLLSDLYCRSSLGAPSDVVSAYAAINFLWSEFYTKYLFPGGPGYLSEFFESELRGDPKAEILADATVIRVSKTPSGNAAVYFLRENTVFKATTNHVICALPKYMLRYIMPEMDEININLFDQFRYSPYIVVNLILRRHVYAESYGTWFSSEAFTDIVDENWVLDDAGAGSQVLTAYVPISESEREKLNDDSFIETQVRAIIEGLSTSIIHDIADVLQAIEVYIRGHAMVIPYAGFLTNVITKLNRRWGPVIFANTDTLGVPAIDTAIWSGIEAARLVK